MDGQKTHFRPRPGASIFSEPKLKIMKMKLTVTAIALGAGLVSLHAADAHENWDRQCAKCHGKTGAADTKIGSKLGVRDLTDPKVQSSFTDQEAFKDIKNGIKEGGRTKMPGYDGKLSDDEIHALVTYVRSLKKS